MDLSKEEAARLRDEAGAIRLRFKALGKALRSEPANADYLRERLKLQNRYNDIERVLSAARIRVDDTDHDVDADLVEARKRALASGQRPVWQPVEADAGDTDMEPQGGQSAFRTPRVPSSAYVTGEGVSWRGMLRIIRTILVVVLLITLCSILLLIYSGRIGFYIVPSESMMPTLRPNDQLVATRQAKYAPGEIVVFSDPNDPESFLVKRIAGVGGDLLEVRNRTLYRNGVAVVEPYLREAMDFRMKPYRVPDSMVFVAGDNRNESDDSFRSRKPVPVSTIRGRVRYIYLPNERRGPMPGD